MTGKFKAIVPAHLPADGRDDTAAIIAIGSATFVEALDDGAWSLHLNFGKGPCARDKMRLASDFLKSMSGEYSRNSRRGKGAS